MKKYLLILSTAVLVACSPSSSLKIPTGCPYFEVEHPKPASNVVVKASDFGFSEKSDKNATAINAALAECRKVGAARLELAPGTYRCIDEPGVVIEDFSDFTFDGKGAVLVFRRPAEYRGQPQSELILDKGNIGIRRCARTVVENFTMDWDWENDPLAASVTVCGKYECKEKPEESYVDLLFKDYDRYPSYPSPVPVQLLRAMNDTFTAYRPASMSTSILSFGYTEGHFGAKNEWVKPNVLRVWPGIPMEGRNQNPATGFRYSPKENLSKVSRLSEGDTFRLQHYYYGKNGINMESNKHLTLRDVNVWSCFGMAMVIDGKQKYWQVERVVVAPPTKEQFEAAYPGRRFFERPVSSTSDGHHVARSSGWCKYIACRWSRNNDDATNFHDRFTIAVRAADNVLDVINKRGFEYFRAEKGAELELRYPNFAPTGFRTHVSKIKGNRIFVEDVLPKQEGQCFLVWDRTYGTDNVLLRDCVFEDPGWRQLFSPSNLTIEDCVFRRTPTFPIRLISDYRSNLWCEGMGSSNVVIRGCTFEDCCISKPESAIISTACVVPDDWNVGEIDPGFVGGDLLIEGNRFIRPSGPVLELQTGRNVIFRNNVIENENNMRATEKSGQILTGNAVDVHIEL